MSVLDYTQRRLYGYRAPPDKILVNYASRKMPLLFDEREYHLGTLNKVFTAQWLSANQVVCATKCNKLFVLDLKTGKQVFIPTLQSRSSPPLGNMEHCGIHSVAINPSGTLLATGGEEPHNLAIYRLPSFDPLHIGEGTHTDWIFSITWLDDKFLVTGSRDSSVAVWEVEDSIQSAQPTGTEQSCRQSDPDSCLEQLHKQQAAQEDEEEQLHNQAAQNSNVEQPHSLADQESSVNIPSYSTIQAVLTKKCCLGEKVRAVVYNSRSEELVGLTSNGYLNVWNVKGLKEVCTASAPFSRENTSLILDLDKRLYAVGSQSHVSLMDMTAMKCALNIPSKDKGTGVRSISFRGDVVTMGTGAGSLLFYDLRAGRFMDCNCGMTLRLRTGEGWLRHDEMYQEFFSDQDHFPNAVYSHLYDDTGVRLVTVGGPLPAGLWGNYAALWS